MTAVPDPRFRDQLAEALLLGSGGRQYWDPEELRDIVDDLLPLIAAEVEARVQAAARWEAEVASVLAEVERVERAYSNPAHRWIHADRIRAALAQPTPTEED